MGVIWFVGVAIWAVAEATVFFIVPDVPITIAVARYGAREGIRLAAAAAFCAALAGLGMWCWGRYGAAEARHVMLMVPAIGPDLLDRARRELAHDWAFHLVFGAVTGLPYKLYAVEAGARNLSPLLFIPMSIVARLARFSLAVGLTLAMKKVVEHIGKPQWRYGVLAFGWLLIYGTYFTIRAHA